MAKPNYQFEKRQKELAKKKKQEEKRRQKLAGNAATDSQEVSAMPPETMPSGSDGDVAAIPHGGS